MYTKVHFVKRARKDIYAVKSNGEQGDLIIAKGESYYWWKWRFRPRTISKTHPGELDQFPYTLAKEFARLQNEVSEVVEENDYDAAQDLIERIEEFVEQREEALSNMECYFTSDTPTMENFRELIEQAQELISELSEIQEDDEE